MRKIQVFRTKLRTELGEQIREFAPTDADIIHKCERWLEQVIEDRRIGATGKYVDDDRVNAKDEERLATDTEIIEDMIEFLNETDAEKEIYEQINSVVVSGGSHYFEEPYESEIPLYMNDIFVLCGGLERKRCGDYFGKEGEWLLMFLKEEVEGIINKTMREHLSDKLPKKKE